MSFNPQNPNGQAIMANSAPVVIASDNGIATSANQTTANTSLSTIATNTGNIPALVTPLYATITVSSSGATTIVAAVASKKIRVINIVLIASGSVNVKFQSHVTPTDLTGLLYLVANTGIAPGEAPNGYFQTIAGEALDINLSGAVAVGGSITYVTV